MNLPWLIVTRVVPDSGATRVDGARCGTRAGLFDELAQVLDLPDYFGRNWDALADVLRDLLAERALEMVVLDAPRLLADEPAQLHTLLEILGDASTRGRLRVILVCPPDEEAALRERLAGSERSDG